MSEKPVGPLMRAILRGGVGIAYAVRSYEQNGVQVADVEYPDIGGSWKACPVVGTGNKNIKAPAEEWDPLTGIDPRKHPRVVIGYREPKRPPLVLDLVACPEIVLTETRDEDQYHAGDPKDPDETVTVNDHVTANGGTKVVVAENGALNHFLNGPMNILLGDGGLRVSSGGESGERIATAGDTADQLNTIINRFNELLVHVAALEAAVQVSMEQIATAFLAQTPSATITYISPGAPPNPLANAASDDLASSGVTIPSRGA